ncbi:hypothetical protein D9619_008418 [Psilocybe cf. subviscida]|uniref:Uncharacterized protein n=1 Tax=Psilocybe cf. subviscida TaxID=2480587 RepID=A0A8H5BA57_9AGAR|nr:hypothetical protein D9619_008418 [Psilocybe cf. subviscida]
MEVALGAIALATAVKDLVELGQKIHKSFAKVSKNLRTAHRLAKDIADKTEKIKAFYDSHKDALDEMEDFRVALLGLLDKFRGFELSILPLLPKTGKRGLGLFVRGWWNNNKIEEGLLELQTNIVQVMLEYMMASAMRTEVAVETNHQETHKDLTEVHSGVAQGLQVLDVVQRNVSAIAAATVPHYSDVSSGTMRDEFARNLIMFAQSTVSTSVPMLRTPNVITEELMTTAYIKFQLNSIAMIVEKMSMPSASAATDVASFLFATTKVASMDITHFRHHVVRQVTHIHDLLNGKQVHIISIYDGAKALDGLSGGLERIGMDHECIQVSNWAITLWRMLVGTFGRQPDHTAGLALSLLKQSMYYHSIGDMIQSLQTVKEAHTITQDHQNHHAPDVHFQILYAEVLSQYARLVDIKQSIQMLFEAIQVLEDILDIQAFTQSTLPNKITKVVQLTASLLDQLFLPAPPIPAIRTYAFALQKLGDFLCIDGHHESAVNLAHLAIALHQKMVSIHGHEYKLDLVFSLSSLMQSKTAAFIPAEELIVMVEECVQLLRELAEKNPVYYARDLVTVLLQKGMALEKLNRDTEAISTWEEVARLSGQIIEDEYAPSMRAWTLYHLSNQFRRLKRHDDAVRTGELAITMYRGEAETQSGQYWYLSRDLRLLRRYKESADAARTSVMLYRHLAMKDPERWMGDLTEVISDLSCCLAALGDYSAAQTAWTESVSMLDDILDTSTGVGLDVIEKYHAALDIHQTISLILKDKEQCLKVSSTVVRHFHHLFKTYADNADIIQKLLQAEFHYAYNILRVGHLQDAQRYIDKRLDEWSSASEIIPESAIANWRATMINLKVCTFDAQGYTKEALLTTQNASDAVMQYVATSRLCFLEMIKSLHHEARLQVKLGNNEQALQVAEKALQLSRGHILDPSPNDLVWPLHAVALTALSCRNYQRVIDTAQEACSIASDPDSWEVGEHDAFMKPSLCALISSAEANLGRRGTAAEYARRAVDESLEIGDMKASISATTAQQSYIETRGNLAEILLATGDLAQARQICEERSAYFSERVENRMGEYRDLAPILRMLGILNCSEERHEEGEAAAKELRRIMKMLGSLFPSLQKEVKIQLRHQAQVLILKVLDNMSQKLDCGHQTEVKSLFAI